LAHTLLTDLADFTRTDTATKARLQLLQEKTNSAAKAYYRMQGRLGVVLRMRTLLTSIAGRVYLTQDDRAEQRQSYERLRACEALTLGDAHVAVSLPVPPEPFPSYGEELKLAEAVLPGPPTVGSDVLPLRDLTSYRGTLPVALTSGGPYLLFFWATWCAPCKASLPEVVAFERASGIPVVAITDEPPAKLVAFFNKYNAPFPAIVAVDELRKAFLAYGVSGTPTFVLADAAGKVQSVTVGYRTEVGLALPGWSGNRPNPAPTQESRP